MAQSSSQSAARFGPSVRVHPTAILEDGVRIGEHSSVWDNVHIRRNASIGHHTIIGEKSYVAYDVTIGNYVKINAYVYIPAGVVVEDKVMISAGTIFTNDMFPRAYDYAKKDLASSEPSEETLQTFVREGATLGAGVTVLAGLEIGKFALVGAGAVVTKTVPPHALVVGNPARVIGWVCVCGKRLDAGKKKIQCASCGKSYRLDNDRLATSD